MRAIHVRNVPESTLAALRERAARHGRSMQQEVLDILEKATEEQIPPQSPRPIQLVTAKTSGESTWRREDMYGDEGR